MKKLRLLLLAFAFALGTHGFLSSQEVTNLRRLVSFQSAIVEPMEPPSLPPRLEFFHIPKSGGTMLEVLAGKNNVTWGACHFMTLVLSSKNTNWKTLPPWPSCPILDNNTTYPNNAPNYWHLPLYMLPHWLSFDAYDVVHPTLIERPKRFFTVIRNPYDRMISLYYYVNFKTNASIVHDPKRLNDFILTKVANESCPQARECFKSQTSCHGIFWCGTQYDFIYYQGKPVLHHILHFETLKQEFNTLSSMYGLNFTITETPPKLNERLLTRANLSHASLRFINHMFRKDFTLGRGYEMIQPQTKKQERSSKAITL